MSLPLRGAGKCFVILGINYQCFFMKNTMTFSKGRTKGVLIMKLAQVGAQDTRLKKSFED